MVSLRAIQQGKVNMSIGYEEGKERTMKAMGNERSYIPYDASSKVGNLPSRMYLVSRVATSDVRVHRGQPRLSYSGIVTCGHVT